MVNSDNLTGQVEESIALRLGWMEGKGCGG
jgi:hypothetical protein